MIFNTQRSEVPSAEVSAYNLLKDVEVDDDSMMSGLETAHAIHAAKQSMQEHQAIFNAANTSRFCILFHLSPPQKKLGWNGPKHGAYHPCMIMMIIIICFDYFIPHGHHLPMEKYGTNDD